jgi:hypothetical protein
MKLRLIFLTLASGTFSIPLSRSENENLGQYGTDLVSIERGHNFGKKALEAIGKTLAKRQLSFLQMKPIPLFKTVKLKPVSPRPDVVREQLFYGPLTLKTVQVGCGFSLVPQSNYQKERMKEGFSLQSLISMDPQSNMFSHSVPDFPKNISLLISRTALRDADGNYMGISRGVYNHHISMPNMNKFPVPFLACPAGSGISGLGDMPVPSVAGVGEDG